MAVQAIRRRLLATAVALVTGWSCATALAHPQIADHGRIPQSPTELQIPLEVITSSAPAPSPGPRRLLDEPTKHQPPADWPRIVIADPYTRWAAEQSLTGAARWLAHPECRTLVSEFHDPLGRPLSAKLSALGVTEEGYLRLVTFLDDPASGHCGDGTLAFTSRGSRVVYLCGRQFERAWRKDSAHAQATIVHELLHSLGLGERPPSPEHITYRVMKLCWR